MAVSHRRSSHVPVTVVAYVPLLAVKKIMIPSTTNYAVTAIIPVNAAMKNCGGTIMTPMTEPDKEPLSMIFLSSTPLQ